jgi:hypothetical protein
MWVLPLPPQELKRVAAEELDQCEVDLDAEAREDDELR